MKKLLSLFACLPATCFASESDSQLGFLALLGLVAIFAIYKIYNKYGETEQKANETNRELVQAKIAEAKEAEQKQLDAIAEQKRLREEKELEIAKAKQELFDNVKEGKLPDVPEDVYENFPFAFGKNERLIYAWKGVQVRTVKRKTRMAGATGGVSFRVAKGLTLRTGGISGHSERVEEEISLGRCLVAVTSQNIFLKTPDLSIKKCSTKQIVGILNDERTVKVEFSRLLPLTFTLNEPEAEYFKIAAMYNIKNS